MQSGISLRRATGPRYVSPGNAAFLVSWTDHGHGDIMTFRPRQYGRTDEGRKGATDGRKETVNDGLGTRYRV
jgi:hypothetical protein